MPRSFRLPDLGEGIHEGEVLAVHVAPGQEVREGDVILEVETDKAAVEIPSPFTGTVVEVLVRPGDTVEVGAVMLTFDTRDAREAVAAAPEEARPAEGGTARRAPEPSAAPTPVPASPATRRLARELGVDLRQVTPTGTGGVVTAADVKAAGRPTEAAPRTASAAPPRQRTEAPPRQAPEAEAVTGTLAPPGGGAALPELPDFTRWGPVERAPLRSIRKATAAQMAAAWSQIPHVSTQDLADVTRLEAFRGKHRADIEAAGGRLTLTVFVLKALPAALKAYPEFNAAIDLRGQEIIYKNYYHIGVAVQTDAGLVVPVIRDVDRKSIRELAVELPDLVRKTRARKVARESLLGGTFTITNAGALGGGFFTPIINFPEVAILGMGQARLQPVVETRGGTQRIAARLMMPLVLCFDHRVADGAGAIGFMRQLIGSLQDPDEMLMSML